MTAARLLEPASFTDPAQRQGEAIADRVIAAIRAGASDPDRLMLAFLQVVADAGHMLPPSGLLRGLCAGLQREIESAAPRNSGHPEAITGGRDDVEF